MLAFGRRQSGSVLIGRLVCKDSALQVHHAVRAKAGYSGAREGGEMTARQALCSCGELRVLCEGEPAKVSICHCDDCRRRTGSAFGIAAFFDRSRITIEGKAKLFTRNSDSGHKVDFHFCPTCGSTVFYEPARKPDMIAVAVGTFADPLFPMPQQSVWDDKRYTWIAFPDEMLTRPLG